MVENTWWIASNYYWTTVPVDLSNHKKYLFENQALTNLPNVRDKEKSPPSTQLSFLGLICLTCREGCKTHSLLYVVKITEIPSAVESTDWDVFHVMQKCICTIGNHCLFIRTGDARGKEIKIPHSSSAVWDSSTRPVAQEYLTLLEKVQISEQVPFLFSQVVLSSHLELCVFLATQPATLQTVN